MLALLNLGGLIALFVGLFITLPIAIAALMFAYEDMFSANGDAPAPEKGSAAKGWGAATIALALLVGFVAPCEGRTQETAAIERLAYGEHLRPAMVNSEAGAPEVSGDVKLGGRSDGRVAKVVPPRSRKAPLAPLFQPASPDQ